MAAGALRFTADMVVFRSLCLFVESISDTQMETMVTCGYMRIGAKDVLNQRHVPVRLYHNAATFILNSDRIDNRGRSNWIRRCMATTKTIPYWDLLLAKKLLIEADFDYFMRRSNMVAIYSDDDMRRIYSSRFFADSVIAYYSRYPGQMKLPKKVLRLLGG